MIRAWGFALAALFSHVSCDASDMTRLDETELEESPIPGFKLVVPKWEVEIVPGGPMVHLNGTIQEVELQAIQMNPEWHNTYIEPMMKLMTRNKKLLKRSTFYRSWTECGPGRHRWEGGYVSAFEDGVRYLRGVRGRPYGGAGPGTCGRVSCSYQSGVYWCNNDSRPKTLISFGSIADGVQAVLDYCPYKRFAERRTVVGQAHHTTHWSVIARYDPHRC